ncbi:MAG: glycosyltransferase family 2 protein [Paludibacteraceae bacterium]|jgi:hypothetical protein|nr:glycosyltransferase family 2 protein [Paludibacteraceae bacterium]
MKLTRYLYLALVWFLEGLLKLKRLNRCTRIHFERYSHSPERLDLITIAFNNEKVIEQQARLIRKYIKGEYNYIVADNSSNKDISLKIKEFCWRNHIIYIRLPKNYLGIISASYSHAASLNWIYQKLIKPKEPSYFGFIDHDLFPIKEIDITKKMGDESIYGRVVNRGDFWYLWAGLCFYRFNFVKNRQINFLPTTVKNEYLDSGGGNWHSIYSFVDASKLTPCDTTTEQIREGNNYHSDFIQYMDNCWIHLINGSNWANKKPKNLSFLLQKNKSKWIDKKPKEKELIDSILMKY